MNGGSQQPSNSSAFSVCSDTRGWGLRLFFLVSLKRGSQRRQEAFSNMLVQVCMWAGVCKGHSECTSGLSCATCCQDPIERDLKKGLRDAILSSAPEVAITSLQGSLLGHRRDQGALSTGSNGRLPTPPATSWVTVGKFFRLLGAVHSLVKWR